MSASREEIREGIREVMREVMREVIRKVIREVIEGKRRKRESIAELLGPGMGPVGRTQISGSTWKASFVANRKELSDSDMNA